MRFGDLREFIDEVARSGELKIVEGAHWDGEIGCITELMAEQADPAVLLFDRIGAYPAGYRVLTNALTTMRRTALVLGLPEHLTGIELLKAWRQRLKMLKPIPPVEVRDAPVKQNVHAGRDVDLFKFPAPKWHEFDGGRYLGTADAVIVRDPDEGWVNLGTHRCMIQGRNRMTVKLNRWQHGRMILEKFRAKGQECPVAVSFGHDPALFIAASETVPWGLSEYDFAGGLRGEPIQVTKGEATDLPIPATAEMVVEGLIPPEFDDFEEGPFGEWPGYLADTTRGNVPVIAVKSVLHRDDPIILGSPPMKPPTPFRCALTTAAVHIWEEMERAGIVGITGVWVPVRDLRLLVVVAIRQMYAGHASQAGIAATACRGGRFGRIVIVVDSDVDITNLQEVMWAVATRCNPDAITTIAGMPATYADPLLTPEQRLREDITTTRVVINACRPYTRISDFARVNVFSSEYRESTRGKWRDLFTTGK